MIDIERVKEVVQRIKIIRWYNNALVDSFTSEFMVFDSALTELDRLQKYEYHLTSEELLAIQTATSKEPLNYKTFTSSSFPIVPPIDKTLEVVKRHRLELEEHRYEVGANYAIHELDDIIAEIEGDK